MLVPQKSCRTCRCVMWLRKAIFMRSTIVNRPALTSNSSRLHTSLCQVETFGSMGKRERVEFILEQMRLCLAKKDTVRTQIISKKISTRFFTDEDTHDLKLKFYNLMLQLAQHDAK